MLVGAGRRGCVARTGRAGAVASAPFGVRRCGRRSGAPAPACGRGHGQPRPPRSPGEPDHKAAALARAGVLRAPVRDLVRLLGNAVPAALVQRERQGGHPAIREVTGLLHWPGPKRHWRRPCNNAAPAASAMSLLQSGVTRRPSQRRTGSSETSPLKPSMRPSVSRRSNRSLQALDRVGLLGNRGGCVFPRERGILTIASRKNIGNALRPPLILKQHRTFRGRLAVLPADGRIVRSAAAGDGLAWWG